MRQAELVKAEPVVYEIGGYSCQLAPISTDDAEVAEFELKAQFHKAKLDIRKRQVEGEPCEKCDGYILYLGNLYKASVASLQVTQMEGSEAKGIKHRLKSMASNAEKRIRRAH